MESLIIETGKTEGGKLKALMLFLTALEIPFKKAEAKSPYDADFVAKIEESVQDKQAGRTRKITLDDIWKSN